MILAAFVWGSGHPAGKIILREITPQQLTLLSSMSCAIVLAIWLTLTKKTRSLSRIRGRVLTLTLASGAIMFFLYPNLSFSALRLIPASANSILVATSTIFVAILAALFLKERLRTFGYLGILVSFVGIALVIASTELGSLNAANLSVFGSILALLGAVASALYAIVGRRLAMFDAMCITLIGAAFGGALQALLLGVSGGFSGLFGASLETYGLIAYWGVFSGLAYVTYYYCLGRMEATRVSSFIFLSPLFATLLSSVALGEQLTAPFLTGLALTLGGIWVTQRGQTK